MTPTLAILIVSADRLLARRLSRFLEAFGYQLAQAADANQALAAAQAATPDFLLVDAGAGQPAQLQLARQIRKGNSTTYTYALWITSAVDVSGLTEALEAGYDDFLARPLVFGELLARLRAGARVIEFERRLAEQTGIDAATGLPAKGELLGRLNASLAEETAGGWLAFLDFDYFRRIERQHGQSAAREVLHGAAAFVRQQCGESLQVAGWGDDRLAILSTSDPPAGASGIAWATELLAKLAAHEFKAGVQPLRLTASIGLATLTAGEAVEPLLGRAERALQLAKSSGRNCAIAGEHVERDTQEWADLAEGGKLFATTTARDVMMPCAVTLGADETIEQAQALVELTRLAAIPVVDADGRLAGLVTPALLEAVRSRSSRSRGGNSVRLVRQVMTSDVQRFDEATPLSELMEFFTSHPTAIAVVVRDRHPRGIVNCQGLAALNERLTPGHFVAPAPLNGASEGLLVPDFAMAE
ncbi:MAG: diguanylate cyclase [Pirellulaceae bacterium]|nr:diguanylate cyclase [Pirellulaceae bacterium]